MNGAPDETPTRFEFEFKEALIFGVSFEKHGLGYDIPIMMDPEGPQLRLLRSAAEQSGVTLYLFGNVDGYTTLCLRCDHLSGRQRAELLLKGAMVVHVVFEVASISERPDGSRGFRYVVTKLRKVRSIDGLSSSLDWITAPRVPESPGSKNVCRKIGPHD